MIYFVVPSPYCLVIEKHEKDTNVLALFIVRLGPRNGKGMGRLLRAQTNPYTTGRVWLEFIVLPV